MNIDHIRSILMDEVNVEHHFQYVGSRGMCEDFSGKIVKVYSRCFLILTEKGFYKSFSYSDFLLHSLKILR